MTDFFKKHTLIAGTLLLTATGFITRVLGFFYRIFLSRTIGAEGLGLYNMVHPIYGICFGICAGSLQTAISQYTAAHLPQSRRIFKTGLLISLSAGLALAWLIARFSGPLAHYILLEDQCAALLPVMAVSVPFSAIHACVNGYCYGLQKAKVPAFAQIVEQIVRMGAVFLIAGILLEQGREITVELAVAGHLIGEIASCLYTVFCFTFLNLEPQDAGSRRAESGTRIGQKQENTAAGRGAKNRKTSKEAEPAGEFAQIASALMALALPLMGSRLILNLLASAESIWIPNRLTAFGMSASEAFSVYGVLTGMAMPFILFPSAITNSMAVVLLPAVAEAQSSGQPNRIAQAVTISLRYSLYMGILCIGVFTLFGESLGVSVFKNAAAGKFMRILAWLCPFLYLSTTTGSILNGLGRTRTTFLQSAAVLLLRIGFVLFGIPRFGILAYLWGMLAAELLLSFLHLWSLKRIVSFSWNIWEMAVRPAAFLLLSIGVLRFLQGIAAMTTVTCNLPDFIKTAVQAAVLALCYGFLLLTAHTAKKQPSAFPERAR